MSTAGAAVDTYLTGTLLPALFPAATIVRGAPGVNVTLDVVSLQSTTVDDAQACMGPHRRRDETMTVTLLLSATRFGDASAQQVADEAAWGMLDTLREALRSAPEQNLAGAVRYAELTSYSLARPDDPELLEKGRNATITAVLTVRAHN